MYTHTIHQLNECLSALYDNSQIEAATYIVNAINILSEASAYTAKSQNYWTHSHGNNSYRVTNIHPYPRNPTKINQNHSRMSSGGKTIAGIGLAAGSLHGGKQLSNKLYQKALNSEDSKKRARYMKAANITSKGSKIAAATSLIGAGYHANNFINKR